MPMVLACINSIFKCLEIVAKKETLHDGISFDAKTNRKNLLRKLLFF